MSWFGRILQQLLTSSGMDRDGIGHEEVCLYLILTTLHHLLTVLEGRTSNPEKEKIMGDKDQCEIQIRCYKYTDI